MGQVRISLAAVSACLLFAGCESTGSRDSGLSASMGVTGDKAQIQKSLSTMDEMVEADRSVVDAKMDWLIENGLYDPENENPLPVGEMAPDFQLMPLRFYDFKIDQGITKSNAHTLFEPVTLSSFQDKLPVVLIFGSYT